jgi:hypothetical protein
LKYCAKCSSLLADEDQTCPNCGTPVGAKEEQAAPSGFSAGASDGPTAGSSAQAFNMAGAGMPPKYMAWSIVLLIFSVLFCLVTGLPGSIVALVYGSKVDTLMAQGKKDEAWQASKVAKIWLIVSTAVTGGIIIISIFAIIAVAVAAALDA